MGVLDRLWLSDAPKLCCWALYLPIRNETTTSYKAMNPYRIKVAIFSSLLGFATLLSSCTLDQVNAVLNDPNYLQLGLRSLLKVSTDTSVKKLSAADGYFRDQLIKILLPPDAQDLIKGLQYIGQQQLVDDLILRLNRGAEAAAVKATPIFVKAITNITFNDAINIVNGTNDTAATQFLRVNTSSALYNAFLPQVDTVLAQPLVAGLSAKESWSQIINLYEGVRTSPANLFLNLRPINSNLSQYVTQKALDGLYFKIKGHEQRIRTDVNLRVTDDIRRLWQR